MIQGSKIYEDFCATCHQDPCRCPVLSADEHAISKLQAEVEQLRQDLRISEINRVTFLGWLDEIGREVGLKNDPGYSHAGVLVAIDEDKQERDTLRQERDDYFKFLGQLADLMGTSMEGSQNDWMIALEDACAALRQRCEALEAALRPYADPQNWKCARCGRHDPINCFNARYVGPTPLWDGEPYSEGSQPWEMPAKVLSGGDPPTTADGSHGTRDATKKAHGNGGEAKEPKT